MVICRRSINSYLNSESSGDLVCINSIDNMFTFCNIDFITVDVEGSEGEVLGGAENYINYSPLLAIAVYHKIIDIWGIALKLHL